MIKTIAVTGAGTMGSGIALTAALNNFTVILFDTNEKSILNAKQIITDNLNFLLSKNKIAIEQLEQTLSKITFTTLIEQCVADVVIEAIIEDLSIKETLYKKLSEINDSKTILASNTSSLSITAIQKNIKNPERIAGMHFFNPAHVMKLVEVVAGEQTSTHTMDTVYNLCKQLQKTPVICKDAPGFIVNRVARHFYLEAMRQAENNNMPITDIDTIIENAGFKMGPFKLMDLIGLDINYAVSKTVYESFNNNPRFLPATMQANKVAAGKLGKKTGEGFYTYSTK
jgi:3-hydroxybutyryl-CoA dehydrogenase